MGCIYGHGDRQVGCGGRVAVAADRQERFLVRAQRREDTVRFCVHHDTRNPRRERLAARVSGHDRAALFVLRRAGGGDDVQQVRVQPLSGGHGHFHLTEHPAAPRRRASGGRGDSGTVGTAVLHQEQRGRVEFRLHEGEARRGGGACDSACVRRGRRGDLRGVYERHGDNVRGVQDAHQGNGIPHHGGGEQA